MMIRMMMNALVLVVVLTSCVRGETVNKTLTCGSGTKEGWGADTTTCEVVGDSQCCSVRRSNIYRAMVNPSASGADFEVSLSTGVCCESYRRMVIPVVLPFFGFLLSPSSASDPEYVNDLVTTVVANDKTRSALCDICCSDTCREHVWANLGSFGVDDEGEVMTAAFSNACCANCGANLGEECDGSGVGVEAAKRVSGSIVDSAKEQWGEDTTTCNHTTQNSCCKPLGFVKLEMNEGDCCSALYPLFTTISYDITGVFNEAFSSNISSGSVNISSNATHIAILIDKVDENDVARFALCNVCASNKCKKTAWDAIGSWGLARGLRISEFLDAMCAHLDANPEFCGDDDDDDGTTEINSSTTTHPAALAYLVGLAAAALFGTD